MLRRQEKARQNNELKKKKKEDKCEVEEEKKRLAVQKEALRIATLYPHGPTTNTNAWKEMMILEEQRVREAIASKERKEARRREVQSLRQSVDRLREGGGVLGGATGTSNTQSHTAAAAAAWSGFRAEDPALVSEKLAKQQQAWDLKVVRDRAKERAKLERRENMKKMLASGEVVQSSGSSKVAAMELRAEHTRERRYRCIYLCVVELQSQSIESQFYVFPSGFYLTDLPSKTNTCGSTSH